MSNEENFITVVRRLIRSSQSYCVLNVRLNQFAFIRSNRELLKLIQNGIVDIAVPTGGEAFLMTCGDVFVIYRGERAATIAEITDRITALAFPDRRLDDQENASFVETFLVPRDYGPLRERSNAYLEGIGVTPTAVGAAGLPEIGAEPDGPLTASILTEIERRIGDVDITQFLRAQPVYEIDQGGRWRPLFEERYTSIPDLRDAWFPKVALRGDEHLFRELCRTLDGKVLLTLLRQPPAPQPFSLNLAVQSIYGAVFTRFTRDTPAELRQAMVIEIDRADLFQDLSSGLRALRVLRENGYRTALDGIGFDLLPYLNVGRFEVDYLKITISRDHLGLLGDPAAIETLRQVDRRKAILCRCDHDTALQVGQALGITKFQGRLLDERAAATRRPAMA